MPQTHDLDLVALENNIKLLMQKKHITQNRLAAELHMVQSTFNKHLKGNPCFSIKEIFTISQFFHVSIDDLCSNTFADKIETTSTDNSTEEAKPELKGNQLAIARYHKVCSALADIFKNTELCTQIVSIEEIVYDQEYDPQYGGYTGEYVRRRDNPKNEYPAIYFSNYLPVVEHFDSENEWDMYTSELRCLGNYYATNFKINRFLKKLIDLHTTFKNGSMTYFDYIRSIDNNLFNVLDETKT